MPSRRLTSRIQAPTAALDGEAVGELLQCIADGVLTTDAQGRVLFMNPAAEAITGWALADAVGTAVETIVPLTAADGSRKIEIPARTALAGGAVVQLVKQGLLTAKDGRERQVDASAVPAGDAVDAAGILLVLHENGGPHPAARPALDRLDDARSIIATLREPFLVLQKDLRVLSANKAFYRTFQTSKEETERRSLFELGNRQWDTPKLRTLLADVLKRDDSFEGYEVAHDFPVIGPRVMLLHGRRIQAPADGSELLLLAMDDITASREVDLAVQISETRYRRLFETARDGILILDSDSGHILDANPFMVELLGYTHAELCGKELWQIGLFKDIEANRIAFAELQARHYVRYHNLPLQNRAGDQIEVEFVSNVYDEGDGTVIQCNIRDHTEHSRLERHSQQQAAALAEAYRRKDEFLAMLSHELRNPLSAIGNAVQVLRIERGDNSRQRHAKDILERQVRQLANLVDDLLEVSRITTGKLQLRPALLDMQDVLARAVEAAQPLIDGAHHTLTVALPPGAIWIHGDPTRLEQIIVNLLSNAAKYTEQAGAIHLAVQIEAGCMVLSVRDTGFGIAPDALPLIFNLFMQAERTLDRTQGGLGVGLTLVQKLVEMHGGTVEAASAGLDRGSEFTVRLPLAPAPPLPDSTDVVAPTEHPVRKRVLVVDDNADAADIIAMLLKHDGHLVRTVYTGDAALTAFADFRPHLVLLDIGLPGMDGYEVARALRRNPDSRGACLVAFTGYGHASDRRAAEQAGFDHHWVKPIEYGKIQDLLDRL